jgi:hypothetical protein
MKIFVKIRAITTISLVFFVLGSLSPHFYCNTIFSTNNSSPSAKTESIKYDITPIIAALIAGAVALAGFFWGLVTYKKDQDLRRKDVIFPLINEFDESKQMKIAKYLLDDKKIERGPDWKWPDELNLTGRSTKFNNFDNNQVYFHGEVATSNDNVPVPDGKVILTISLGDGKTEEMGLDLSNGQFSTQISHGWQSVRAYYVPIAGYADCNSKRIYNENVFRWHTETWERLQSFVRFGESTDELLNRLMDTAAEKVRDK